MKKLIAILISIMMVFTLMLPALAEGSYKDETVYILSESDGTTQKIIVSDWLSNPNGDSEIMDQSNLNDIENVKGEQAFSDGAWQANGADIYYQGECDTSLPIELKISYMLDGNEISPDELAGKNGHITIRFDYSVVEMREVLLNDVRETVQVPFVTLTGVLLENDVFSNVEAMNAHIVNDGDHTFVVGVALPGLQESLELDKESVELPAYVEIEADVKAFALPVTVTLASSEIFAKLDADDLNDMQDLKRAMDELTEGMNALLDGSVQLGDGLNELNEGADRLAEGLNVLSEGLTTLISNNEDLVSGSRQVFETLIATANQQLAAANAELPELTVENYEETLRVLIESMSEAGITQQARTQVEQAVRAQEDQVRAAVTQAVQAEVETQVNAAAEETVRTQVLAAMNMDMEAYNAARENNLMSNEQVSQIEGAVEQQMASDDVQNMIVLQTQAQMNSEDVLALIEENTEAQIQLLIEENMNGADVQAQIEVSVNQYQETAASLEALKEQLDRYNTFHSGLIAYTEGASSAANGAVQLKDAMPELQDGIAQLAEGALAMKEGLEDFNQEGVQKLDELVNDDLDGLLARVRGLIYAAQDYKNYSRISDEMDGAVRFIWRSAAIEG